MAAFTKLLLALKLSTIILEVWILLTVIYHNFTRQMLTALRGKPDDAIMHTYVMDKWKHFGTQYMCSLALLLHMYSCHLSNRYFISLGVSLTMHSLCSSLLRLSLSSLIIHWWLIHTCVWLSYLLLTNHSMDHVMNYII